MLMMMIMKKQKEKKHKKNEERQQQDITKSPLNGTVGHRSNITLYTKN